MATEVFPSRRGGRRRDDWFERYSRTRNAFMFENSHGEVVSSPPTSPSARVIFYGTGLCPDTATVGNMSFFWWPHDEIPPYEGENQEAPSPQDDDNDEFVHVGSPMSRCPSVASLGDGMGSSGDLIAGRDAVRMLVRHLRGDDEPTVPAWMRDSGGAGSVVRSDAPDCAMTRPPSVASVASIKSVIPEHPSKKDSTNDIDLRRRGRRERRPRWRKWGIIACGAAAFGWFAAKVAKRH